MAGTANLKSFPPRRVSPRRPVTKSEVHPEVRGPLPSTEASIVIMLSLCPGGRLRTGVRAGRRPFLIQILGVVQTRQLVVICIN